MFHCGMFLENRKLLQSAEKKADKAGVRADREGQQGARE